MDRTPAVVPSGRQVEIGWRAQAATVVEVGGGIREYRVGDRPVLDPYPLDAMCDGAHGAPLIPWPNRLADGRYRFERVDHQVALSEPDKRNAIHGFLRFPPGQTARRPTAGLRVHRPGPGRRRSGVGPARRSMPDPTEAPDHDTEPEETKAMATDNPMQLGV
ncbi:MAG: aldose epimerase family protein, partial [Acidimicrobiales bacterium]